MNCPHHAFRFILLVAFSLCMPLTSLASTKLPPQDATKVILYPFAAQVQVQTQVQPIPSQNKAQTRLIIPLPSTAVPSSFTLSSEGQRVLAIETQTHKATPSQAKKKLIKQRDALKKTQQAYQATHEGLQAQITFWTESGRDASLKINAMENFAHTMGNKVVALRTEAERIVQKIQDVEEKIIAVDAAIARLGGLPEAPAMLVTLAGDITTPIPVVYSYTMNECGWTPYYRLNALPQNDKVTFDAMATARQRADANWNAVELSIASTPPNSRLQPPPLPTWNIGPQPNIAMRSSAPKLMMAQDSFIQEKAVSLPVQQQATYMVWDLGTRTVHSGEPLSVTLDSGAWPASFRRVIRPAQERTSYLEATISLPANNTLTSGSALYLVEGAVIGERPFSMTGQELKLFFGQDSKVYAIMKSQTIQRGEKGLLNREQRYTWAWDIAVHNEHATAIAARVEDPAPHIRDEAIVLEQQSTPKATKKDDALYWDITLPANSVTHITHQVTITAPADIELIPGRDAK